MFFVNIVCSIAIKEVGYEMYVQIHRPTNCYLSYSYYYSLIFR